MKASTFQLIDLDRTLFDTAAFVAAITQEVDSTQPGLGAELRARFEAAYKKEQTFFLLRYLRQEKGDAWFEDVVSRIVERDGAGAFMMPGARERIAYAETWQLADDYTPAWGIFTYGDPVDQLMKLRILELEDAPVYICETPGKARVIHSWVQPDGRFRLPQEFGGVVVNRLTLEDDKLRAFEGLPVHVTGFWIGAPADTEVALAAVSRLDLGRTSRVVPVRDLYDSVAQLKARRAVQ